MKLKMIKRGLYGAAIFLGFIIPAHSTPNVIATIKPIHSLVSAVMNGVATPGLLITGASSPHDFALKPSQAKSLQKADLIFWVGPELETSLVKPIETIGVAAKSVALMRATGIELLELRESDGDDGHNHGDNHDHNGKHENDGHAMDAHIWLDPLNAIIMVDTITENLIRIDPQDKTVYLANASKLKSEISKLVAELDLELEPFKKKGYIVFHDGYQYFEARFGMKNLGAITINAEMAPGAEHIREIQKTIKSANAYCVFSEPQFSSNMIETVTEGADIQQGVLDPLGANLDDGPELYVQLLRNLAAEMSNCLKH